MKFDVARFLTKREGARETIELEEKFVLPAEDGIHFISHLAATVTLLRLPHEITVALDETEITAETACVRCLKLFKLPIEIAHAERQFIVDLPKEQMAADEDVFYVDKRTHSIDLSPFLREEILLHFPPAPVCFPGCKGLCSTCGADLNTAPCEHT